MTILETRRLILRPWRASDAESLYEYARDPRVGPIAGWPVHTSVDNSREIIRDILSADEVYAVALKQSDIAIGSLGLKVGAASDLNLPPDEAEIGYWIGVPFWNKGYITEATRRIIRHAFEDMGVTVLWCGYFDGNEPSRRVAEKCGFRFQRTEQRHWPLIGQTMTQHITRIAKSDWAAGSSVAMDAAV
jgi:RimJ/RimL family protein N-acetyltransferase